MKDEYDISKLFDIPLKDRAISLEQFDHIYLFELFGLPINATIVSTWIVMFVLVLISLLATHKMKAKEHTGKIQTLLEMVVMWLSGEVKETSGDNPAKYMGMGSTGIWVSAGFVWVVSAVSAWWRYRTYLYDRIRP